jgi:N-acetylglutamate synthase-like GNAT family acetyltransferase
MLPLPPFNVAQSSMSASTPYTIRPALGSDQRQLRRLLQSFFRERTLPFASIHPFIGWVILGGLIALGVHFAATATGMWAIGLRLLLGIGAIVGIGALSPVFRVSVDWHQFWVVEYRGRLIGCAKLCHHKHYSTLYNVLIAAHWRRQGVGTNLVRRVAQEARKPLYLACRLEHIAFYHRVGFEQIPIRALNANIYRSLELALRSDIVPLVLRKETK